MPAGRFDKLVEVQQRVETRNERGETVLSWIMLGRWCARIEDLTGREYWEAQKVKAGLNTEITLREKINGLGPTHRIVYQDRKYEINAAMDTTIRGPRNYGRGQRLLCMEVT